jgi:hypothetical protein
MNARKGLLAPSRARASGALVAPIFSAMPVSVSSSRDPGSNSLLYTLGLSLPAEQHARANQMAPSGRHCPSSAAGDSTWCEIYGQDCHRPAGRRDRSSRRPLSGSRSITLPVSGRNDNKEAIGALPTPHDEKTTASGIPPTPSQRVTTAAPHEDLSVLLATFTASRVRAGLVVSTPLGTNAIREAHAVIPMISEDPLVVSHAHPPISCTTTS